MIAFDYVIEEAMEVSKHSMVMVNDVLFGRITDIGFQEKFMINLNSLPINFEQSLN